ncbi:hypothetical protein [Proteiniclasticum sp.]|uniref:hypothetical protein n=1 Tax=Proteiniclasticum sp. TaxID=2053595 RepID=UPI002896E6C6|nr:hypothetical protein [Proteiniclasticum sp.]
MKIKLNSSYREHDKIVKRLSEELPELTIRSKERSWGEDKPSFKYRKKLYEFDTVEEFVNQAKKILSLTDKDYSKKTKAKMQDIDPKELGERREVEELLLEIPVEKYNLSDLNIKLRLGSHSEKSSSYESSEQTLHYEVEEIEDTDDDGINEEERVLGSDDISMTSINNDIILDIPSEKFSLNDLNLNIKFTQYGEPSSTYEVKKPEKEEKPSKMEVKASETKVEKKTDSAKREDSKTEETSDKEQTTKKAPTPRKPSGAKSSPAKKQTGTAKEKKPSDAQKDSKPTKSEK